jgi:hypothetical protein
MCVCCVSVCQKGGVFVFPGSGFWQAVEAKKDERDVWIPPPKVPFGGPAQVEYQKTTYYK